MGEAKGKEFLCTTELARRKRDHIVIRIFWHPVVRDYIAIRIYIFEVLLGVGDDVEDNRNLRMIWCERAQKCIAVACAASHLVVPALAMLVVTCDVTGVAGPLSLVLLPALLPACAACVLPPLCRLFCVLVVLPCVVACDASHRARVVTVVTAPLCWLLPAMSPAQLDPCPFCCYLRCYLCCHRPRLPLLPALDSWRRYRHA